MIINREGMMTFMYICVMLMTYNWRIGETFIMDGTTCNVLAPCTCMLNYVDCISKNMTRFPAIYPFGHPRASNRYSTVHIRFYGNELISIPSNAFQNVSTANASNVEIQLYKNKITTISDYAFRRIENITTLLRLDDNNLASIPAVIGKLTNLRTLYLQNNPLKTLDAHVLVGIQGSLSDFRVSLGNMTSWPSGIHLLRKLQTLYIDHINFRPLPANAFHGFQITLQTLSLTYTSLERVPDNICSLKHLQSFRFSFNNMLIGDISLHNLCQAPLAEVRYLYLQHDRISHFPDAMFTIFTNLTHLHLDNNDLRYIPYDVIPIQNNLTYIGLEVNSFNGIPSGINRFSNLQTLDMSHNKIFAVGHYDLVDLRHLADLYLSGNPLEHIEPQAFRNQQTSLYILHLRNTNLTTIPLAVTQLQHLGGIHIYKTWSPIECSCDNMAHLMNWNVTKITIMGTCELTNESFKDYIMTSLPSCPLK